MWVLSLLYNETISHRALRYDSTTRVGRHHDYKNDLECVYIPDLKVPKIYITINVGQQDGELDGVSKLTVSFESICTTDVNGKIYKLPSRDADALVEDFTKYTDLMFKINANKSDRIKIRLRWKPVVILAFSKKIQYEGIVQQSPLPEKIRELIGSKIDVKCTDNPFNATHYVTLTDSPDYNLQIAISRSLPIVSIGWCDFLNTSLNDLDSWLFGTRPDLLLHSVKGYNLLPNMARQGFLKDKYALILTDDIDSKHVRRLTNWLKCIMVADVMIDMADQFAKVASTTIAGLGVDQIYCFRILEDNAHVTNEVMVSTNTVEDLWKAVLAVDLTLLRKPKSGFIESCSVEKRQPEDIIPISQRRKRRKLERLDETNFFSFTPLSSSVPPQSDQSNIITRSPSPKLSETRLESLPHEMELAGKTSVDMTKNSVDAQCDNSQMELDNEPLRETSFRSKSENHNHITTDESTVSLAPSKATKQKSKTWIVPEVSLADAVKSMKKLAEDSIKQELALEDGMEPGVKDLLVIEDMVLEAPRRTLHMNQNNYQGRKNFKTFRKMGLQQNSITRTFIELVDNGSAVQFKDSSSPAPIDEGEKIKSDFAAEMEDVRGFQPEMSQLFVGSVSDSEAEQEDATFQFSSTRNSSFQHSRNGVNDEKDDGGRVRNRPSSHMEKNNDVDDEDGDGGVRFMFSRRA